MVLSKTYYYLGTAKRGKLGEAVTSCVFLSNLAKDDQLQSFWNCAIDLTPSGRVWHEYHV